MADRIAALLPAHEVYVEVFGGGASVLFSKPKSELEVYNDRDDGLVLFFRLLRDRPEEFVPLLELTPYSRTEYERARDSWQDNVDELERARRWYVIVAQAFGGHSARHDTTQESGRGWGGERLGRLHLARGESSANRVDHIWRFVERLRGVQIDNLDWRACFEKYDSPGACFYLDPPYVRSTRRSGRYAHELSDADHRELVDRVLRLKGTALVSGYDHEIYAPLERAGYERHEWDVWATAARRTASIDHRRREVVWTLPAATQRLFGALT